MCQSVLSSGVFLCKTILANLLSLLLSPSIFLFIWPSFWGFCLLSLCSNLMSMSILKEVEHVCHTNSSLHLSVHPPCTGGNEACFTTSTPGDSRIAMAMALGMCR